MASLAEELLNLEQIAKRDRSPDRGLSDEALNLCRSIAVNCLTQTIGERGLDAIATRCCFFTAPASPVTWRYHSNFEGGLLYHSLMVVGELLRLNTLYNAFTTLEIMRVGLLHDICKAVYNQPPDDQHPTWWWKRPLAPGHAELSLQTLLTFGISLNEREVCAIRWHMGAYNLDKDALKYYDVAKRRYSRAVLITHWADMAAANFHEWSINPVVEEDKGVKNESEALD